MITIDRLKRRGLLMTTTALAILCGSLLAQAQDIAAVRREIVFTRENQRLFYLDFSASRPAGATLEITSLNDSGSFAGKLDIGTVHPSLPNVSGTITVVRGSGPGSRNALRIVFTVTLERRLELIGSSNAPGSESATGVPTPGMSDADLKAL